MDATAAPSSASGPAVVFVDSRVQDAASLLQGVAPGTEVVTLQAGEDGLQQMADYLALHPEIGSVDVVAHGADGELQLGATDLTAANIASYSQSLGAIGAALKPGADILVYACNTAADASGVQFVDTLAQLTGHTVAASSNATGAGGDWTLEVATGDVAAAPALSAQSEAAYGYSLPTIDTAAELQAAINADDGDSANDTITLTGNITFTAASTIAIDHTGSGVLTIDGAGHTINAAYLAGVMAITHGTVVLENMTIEHGLLAGAGGASDANGGSELGAGISNIGNLTLEGVTVTGNVATGGGGGGGVTGGDVGGGGGGGGGAAGVGGGAGGSAGPSPSRRLCRRRRRRRVRRRRRIL